MMSFQHEETVITNPMRQANSLAHEISFSFFHPLYFPVLVSVFLNRSSWIEDGLTGTAAVSAESICFIAKSQFYCQQMSKEVVK